MKKLLIALGVIIGVTALNAQTYTLDIAKGDTALYYKINDSRPFIVQVETSGDLSGNLTIYSKSTTGVNWHIVDKSLFPVEMGSDESVMFVNREPAVKEWLFVWDRSGQDSGYVFLNIENLRINVGSDYFSNGGVIRGINNNRLKDIQTFDITAQGSQGNFVLPSSIEPELLMIDSISGTDTLFYYTVPSYNLIGTTLTVGFDLDSISGDGCSFGIGGSMFESDFTLGTEFITYDDVGADSTTNTKVEYLQVEYFNYGKPVIWASKGNCSGYVRWFIYINKK